METSNKDIPSYANSSALFPKKHYTYFLLDGASCPDFIPQSRKHKPEHVCLYRGDLDEEMQFVAPYLIELKNDHPFTQWILDNSVGKHWGVFATTSASLVDVRKHFRSLTMVDSPEGKPIYFRFYDPRVLNDFLPTCTPNELARIFGPIDYFLCEHIDEDKNKSEMIQHDAPLGVEPTRGTLKIRQAQMDEMGRKQAKQFISNVAKETRSNFPDLTKSLSDAGLLETIEKNVENAKKYGILLQKDVADWNTLQWLVGIGYETQQPWAKTILNNPQLTDGESKMMQLKSAAIDYLKQK